LASARLVRHRTAAVLLATLLILTATAPGVAEEGCLVGRGSELVSHIGPIAVSGRLVASLQRGHWDTRPGVRVTVMEASGTNSAGRWNAVWNVQDIALNADTAIVAADFGLVALDLSEPLYPLELDFVDLLGADHLAVDSGFAYTAVDGSGGNGWFNVVDVSVPSNLEQHGQLYWDRPEPYWGKTAIDASAGMVVMSCREGLLVIDATDPWRPVERGVWTRNGSRDVVLVNGLAAVAITSWIDPDDIGVKLIDLSDPGQPTSVGFWAAPSAVRSVAEYGGVIIAGTESDGIFLLDITDPTHPVVLEHRQTSDLSVEHLATAWPTIAFTNSESHAEVLGLAPSCLPPRQPSGRLGR